MDVAWRVLNMAPCGFLPEIMEQNWNFQYYLYIWSLNISQIYLEWIEIFITVYQMFHKFSVVTAGFGNIKRGENSASYRFIM